MRFITVWVLLTLVACSDTSTEQDEPTGERGATSDISTINVAELGSRSAAEQRSFLEQAVTTTGNTCSGATRIEYKGDTDTDSVWAIKCAQEEYLVTLNRSESSPRVVTCKLAEEADLNCWKPW